MSSLVDRYLDGELDEKSKTKLEQRLEAEERAQDHFISRLQFHGELLESQQPLRVEMLQKRQVVFEYDKGIPKVMTREAQAVRVGNPKRDTFVELVPENMSMRRVLIVLGALLIMSLGLILFLATRPLPDPRVVEPPAPLSHSEMVDLRPLIWLVTKMEKLFYLGVAGPL